MCLRHPSRIRSITSLFDVECAANFIFQLQAQTCQMADLATTRQAARILILAVPDPVDAHQFPSSRLAFALIRAAAAGLSLPLFRSAYLCLDTGEYLIDNCASEE
jgi:hypothetical protein